MRRAHRPVTPFDVEDEGESPGHVATVDPTATTTLTQGRRGRLWRRISVVAMVIFVGLGLLDVWGTHPASVSTVADGYRITVTHPAVTRAGLPVAWDLTLTRLDAGELPVRIELRSDAAYFALFDHHALSPAPAEEWRTGTHVGWVFEVPDGATEMTVSLDARTEPGVHRGRGGATTVLVDGVEVVAVAYTTRVTP